MIRPVCPKCSGFLVDERDCVKCMFCGWHTFREIVPVMPTPSATPFHNMEYSSLYEQMVAQYLGFIREQMAAGKSWLSIVEQIGIKEGRKLTPSTIHKHFMRLDV